MNGSRTRLAIREHFVLAINVRGNCMGMFAHLCANPNVSVYHSPNLQRLSLTSTLFLSMFNQVKLRRSAESVLFKTTNISKT